MIAALFVMKDGPYFGVDGVEPYDLERNAFTFRGPHRVIAHPPCQLWGKFAGINYKRYGGSHNRPGNDGGCFAHALTMVRKFGGVLEHPADSYAWETFGLQKPTGIGWVKALENEWVCEVWQSAYGHLCRKRTWLLFVSDVPPIELNWNRPDGTHQVGFHDRRGKSGNKPTIRGRAASATPIPFRDLLIGLVRLG